ALSTLGSFAPKLLPILFNVHAITPPDSRATIESAISSLARTADPTTLAAFFKAVLAKIIGQTADGADGEGANEPPTAKRQGELLELAIALTPYLDAPNATLLWRLARPQLGVSSSPAVQKKAYR
ncbi:hypothetical protein T492DRAFT_891908, partial [Pavlovales sp. CCMP2436]